MNWKQLVNSLVAGRSGLVSRLPCSLFPHPNPHSSEPGSLDTWYSLFRRWEITHEKMSSIKTQAASDIHDSRVPEVLVPLAVCLSAAYISVVLRFVSRRIGKIPWRADDWWLVVGLVSRHLHFDRCISWQPPAIRFSRPHWSLAALLRLTWVSVTTKFSPSTLWPWRKYLPLLILPTVQATNHISPPVDCCRKRSSLQPSHCRNQDVNFTFIQSNFRSTRFQSILQLGSVVHRGLRSLL